MSKKTDGKLDSMVENAIANGYTRRAPGSGTRMTDELAIAYGLASAGDYVEATFRGIEATMVKGRPRTLANFEGPGSIHGQVKDESGKHPIDLMLAVGETAKVWLGHQAMKMLEKVAPGEFVALTREGGSTKLAGGKTLEHYSVEVFAS